jgi:hypothetical protein
MYPRSTSLHVAQKHIRTVDHNDLAGGKRNLTEAFNQFIFAVHGNPLVSCDVTIIVSQVNQVKALSFFIDGLAKTNMEGPLRPSA